jgi:thymidylate synthase
MSAVGNRNISFATAASLRNILLDGRTVTVRGNETREILSQLTTLECPLERYLFLPGRLNDVFAQVAESIWVIAGRNDIDWLTPYLPRAPDYSDDGKVWRGGYGPRLRRWRGNIDQVDEVRRLLLADPTSRQAVITLFDPQADFVESKDIPCNNWLSFIARDGRLYLNVAIRSNDVLWGFSGANAFEWSVLHEMMAHWTGQEVGFECFFATSFHLYARHFDRAQVIISHFKGVTPYDFGIAASPFRTPWKRFDSEISRWFALEEMTRLDPDRSWATTDLEDPFLLGCLQLLRLKWGEAVWDDRKLADELAALEETDWLAAAYEHLQRKRPAAFNKIPHRRIAAFLAACA